jgi:hypothetical protein
MNSWAVSHVKMKEISSVSETAAVFNIRTEPMNNSLALALIEWQLPPLGKPCFVGIQPCLNSQNNSDIQQDTCIYLTLVQDV